MKVAILSTHPFVDRHPHKILFLKRLLERLDASNVTVCYLHCSPKHYWKRIRQRFQLQDALSLFSLFRRSPAQHQRSFEADLIADLPIGPLPTIAKRWNVTVRCFSSTTRLARFLEEFSPTIIHNFSGIFIPSSILRIPNFGVVSGHYGELPQLRGGDTIRWSILLDHPLMVTIMKLAPALDMGDILLKRPVPVYSTDSFSSLRFRCQLINALGQIEVFDALRSHSLTPQPQRREEGTTFYRMGRYLRHRAEQRLRNGEYSHFEDQQ